MDAKEIAEYCKKQRQLIKDGANGLPYSVWAVEGDKFYKSVIDLLEQNRWIPVDERLPEAGKLVWLHCFEDYDQCGYYERTEKYSDGQVHLFQNVYNHYVQVTHWRQHSPLPDNREDV